MTFWQQGHTRWQRGLRQAWLAVFAFSSRSLQQITTFVLTLLAGGFLSPAEYGIYTLSVLFVMFLQALIYTGFFNYVVRAKGDEREVADTCFWLILALSGTGSATLFLAAPALARIFDAPGMTAVLRMLALVQPMVALTAWCSSVLMRQNRMKLHFNIMILQNLIALATGVVLLILWKSVFALVVYRVVRACSGASMYLFWSRIWPGFNVRWTVARDAMRYSYSLYGTRILSFASNYGADLALGLMFTTAEAGLYRFGSRLTMGAVDIVAQPMRSFAITQFGAAHRNDEAFGPIVQRFSSTMLVLMGCAAGTIIVFGEDLVRLFFRPEYTGALVVAYAIAIRALLGVGDSLVEPVLASAGHTHAVLAHFAFWTSIQTAAIPLAAGFGMGALAWTGATVALVSSCAAFWLMSRYSGVAIRPIADAVMKAAIFVLAYTLLAYLMHAAIQAEFGAGVLALALSLGLSCLLGLLVLLVAAYQRTFDLRVFAG